MVEPRLGLLRMLLLLAACADNGLKVINTAPEVTITSPGSGTVIGEGTSLGFVARVQDAQEPIEDLTLVWTIDGTDLVGQATINGDDSLLLVDSFDAGEHVIALTAVDASAASGTDSVTIAVIANTAPTLSFSLPVAASTFLVGAPLEVDLVATDADEPDASDLALTWSGSAADGQSLPAAPGSDGHARFFLDLEEGSWTFSATVTDPLGANATALTSFEVVNGDRDGDGHDDVALGGDDCDDSSADVSPAIPESCNGLDDDCDGDTDEGFDADADGTPDCDDIELCDGLDNDGDGEIDEDDATDAVTWYSDNDGDGHGVATMTTAACDAPVGYAGAADDCDDTDAGAFPGAAEVCDGVDQSCDGTVDEGVETTFYADSDGDGYGGTTTADACAAPVGYVATAGDCDDGAVSTSPSAVETCDDVDEDCDGAVDEGFDADGDGTTDCHDVEMCDGLDNDGDGAVDESDAIDPARWYADSDADGYGDAAMRNDACDAPAGYVADATDCDDGDAAFHPTAAETDCADASDYNCDGSVGYVDGDGDGLAACEECDDADAAIHPGATEVCDGADNDCDGAADGATAIDAIEWYADFDVDSFGDAVVTAIACDAPAGYVADGADCDDTDAGVSPGATETCDGEDDDCDGSVDEDEAADASTWYADVDGDTYGGATTTVSCAAPSGYVALSGDCDDAVAAISPAATEVCDASNTDEDCDGLADDLDIATGTTTWCADADGDTYGGAATIAACDPPSGYVATSADCDDSDSGVYPGAAEACDGEDDDCDGTVDDGVTTIYYADADGDTYGGSTTADACSAPSGYVATSTDCDDTAAAVNPGATETCNGDDDDCDGTVDEDGASDAITWYIDGDGDTYGGATTAVSCVAPSGYVALSGDCDDAVAAISPAATEVCDSSNTDEDCDGLSDDLDTPSGTTTWYADADGDADGDAYGGAATIAACDLPSGYVATSTDCDDTESGVYPGAAETCDGEDDDCDGTVDDGVTTTYYADADGDTHGGSTTAAACSAPSGYVATSTDCDDTRAAVNTGASELCSTAYDDDCDGSINEVSAADATTFYIDADSDTYGGATTTTSCAAPSGYVALSGDCDDAVAAISPAATEVCDASNTDEDCDGLADDLDIAAGTTTWYADADGDTYGGAVTISACDLSSGYVATSSDCDDGDGGMHPGAVETCDGEDDDCDGTVDDGVTTTYYADADGDTHGGSTTAAACSAPSGYVATSTDCDDSRAAVNTAASELCSTAYDDDCDGSTNESSATDAGTFYIDADGDTYGGATTSVACTAPAGYVAVSGDCDDGSAAMSPGDPEICDGSDTDEDCDGLADDLDTGATGTTTWYADADGDTYGDVVNTSVRCDVPSGFVANDDDCDDNAATVSPAGVEVCNLDDDDCDGSVDEDASDAITWYADVDADTYGSTTSTLDECEQPSGYLTSGTDCDDARAAVNPAANELCSTTYDDDCDGSTNESSATDASTWYRDADSDSYGVATTTAPGCTRPSGYAAASGDCNDANAAISPGDPEVCDASDTDEDCDALADDADSAATGETSWYLDADADTYGTISSSVSLCDMPSGYVAASTDCDDALATVNPAATDTCGDGTDQDCSGSDATCGYYGDYDIADGADARIYGESSGDDFGMGLAVMDMDGDGDDDVAVGEPGDDDYFTDGGSWFLYSGPLTAGPEDSETRDYARRYPSNTYYDAIGAAIWAIPDIDDDGDDEVAVHFHNTSTGTETLLVYRGPMAAGASVVSTGTYTSVAAGDIPALQRSISGAGDFNSPTGADEWMYGYPTTSSSLGYAYVVTGTTNVGVWKGETAGDAFGQGVAGGPDSDIDGDGYDDVWFGAPGDDDGATDAGAIYAIKGPVSASSVTVVTASADTKVTASGASDAFGGYMRFPGDVDGDGYGDVLAAAAADDDNGVASGTIFIFLDGESETSTAGADIQIIGAAAGDGLGGYTMETGDVDADGEIDILLGSSAADVNGTDSGAAWLIHGPLTGTYSLGSGDYDARFYGDAGDDCGRQGGLGDTDGDGMDDIVLGCADGDASSTLADYGTVSVYLGF